SKPNSGSRAVQVSPSGDGITTAVSSWPGSSPTATKMFACADQATAFQLNRFFGAVLFVQPVRPPSAETMIDSASVAPCATATKSCNSGDQQTEDQSQLEAALHSCQVLPS